MRDEKKSRHLLHDLSTGHPHRTLWRTAPGRDCIKDVSDFRRVKNQTSNTLHIRTKGAIHWLFMMNSFRECLMTPRFRPNRGLGVIPEVTYSTSAPFSIRMPRSTER